MYYLYDLDYARPTKDYAGALHDGRRYGSLSGVGRLYRESVTSSGTRGRLRGAAIEESRRRRASLSACPDISASDSSPQASRR